MYVCHCAVVTDRDVMESLANGARCLAQVCRDTSAGRGCGRCVETLKSLVCQHVATPETSAPGVARAAG